ncbi:MAG: hypothetical protein KAR13_15875 [Desulfobulbaceae bacterium]|nr:hypothetical protein [Desulfobulbaceae bacterium]MCK5323186.1 hypothetical protein [Desulfobulbaceae bacterium]MCK5543702.1 hypothetical protein [Desulfobulbaceae bacterium]
MSRLKVDIIGKIHSQGLDGVTKTTIVTINATFFASVSRVCTHATKKLFKTAAGSRQFQTLPKTIIEKYKERYKWD